MFNLQIFGGKGGGTTVVQQPASVPEATPEERQYQALVNQYIQQTSPTALALQQKGANMILNDPGVMNVDYSSMANNEINQANDLQNQSAQLGKSYQNLSDQTTALQNGQVNQNFLNSQLNTIQRGAQQSVGDLLGSLAQKGAVNSSTLDTGLKNITDSVNQAVNDAYMNDISTQSQLIGQQQGILGSIGSNIDRQQTNLSAPMQIANAAQNATIDIPGKILSLATGQSAPATDAWQTMINNRYKEASPAQTAVVQSGGSGGILGGVLGGLASNPGLFCFAAGTLIDTPTGKKVIESFKKEDPVITYDDAGYHDEKVSAVMEPHESDTLIIVTWRGNVTTTPTQPLLTPEGFKLANELSAGDKVVFRGDFVKIDSIEPGKKQLVYDLKVTGSNTYIANGFIAKGGTDEWA